MFHYNLVFLLSNKQEYNSELHVHMQLEFPQDSKSHRILNVHQNVPGVLRNVNSIISDLDVNIKAQVGSMHKVMNSRNVAALLALTQVPVQGPQATLLASVAMTVAVLVFQKHSLSLWCFVLLIRSM